MSAGTITAVTAGAEQLEKVLKKLNTSRSVVIEVDNNTDLTLDRIGDHHSHGGFAVAPHGQIAPHSADVYGSQSSSWSFATGTEGTCTYAGDGLQLTVHWDNPFAGPNSADCSLTGPAAGSYRAVATHGSGNTGANMRFELFPLAPPKPPSTWASGWDDLGGVLSEGPGVVSYASNCLEVVVRGSDGQLWNRDWNGSAWGQFWGRGVQFKGVPAIASMKPGHFDIFVRGMNDHLLHTWWEGSWAAGWEDLGGLLSDSPAATSSAPNTLDILFRGTDGLLYNLEWTGTQWSPFYCRGVAIKGAPAVTSMRPGRLEVFVRGINDHLMHTWWEGSWADWDDLGGILSDSPGATSSRPDTLDVVVRGSDGLLYNKRWTGSDWSQFWCRGFQIKGAPAIASMALDHFDIFVRGTDDHLMHTWWG